MGLDSPEDPGLQPGDFFGHYEILELAGRGGMGVVYKATQDGLKWPVALKLLRTELSDDPEFRDRFLREGQLAAVPRHNNVVLVFDSGELDDRLFLAMEWIDGEDLRSILDRRGVVEPAAAVDIVLQTAGALAAVHAARMIHRDVKPANIIVREDGPEIHAYLTDFGIARLMASGDPRTQTLTIGTPGYLAPEQGAGHPVDHRADLYALGCVFFEALSGRMAFPTDNRHNTLPSLHPQLGSPYEPFDQFLVRAVDIDPSRRYGSAGEFHNALKAAANDCGLLVTRPDLPEPAPVQPPPIRPLEIETSPNGGGPRGPEYVDGQHSNNPPGKRNLLIGLALTLVALIGAAVVALIVISDNPSSSPSSAAGGWKGPVTLGSGPLGSAPTAGADDSGNVYVFWEGTNNVLWQKYLDAGVWNGPDRVLRAGHGIASQPAVAVHAGGQQDVFWKGVDRKLWETSHTNTWSTPMHVPRSGALGPGPAAAVDANGDVYVFWEGPDGTLMDEWNVGAGWKGPVRIKAARNLLASQPSVAVHPNGNQDVFWKSADGSLWELSHTNGWGQPKKLRGGPLASPPTAAVASNGDVVFWQGAQGGLYETWVVGEQWAAPVRIPTGHSRLSNQPAVAVHGDEQDIFWRDTKGTLEELTYTSAGGS